MPTEGTIRHRWPSRLVRRLQESWQPGLRLRYAAMATALAALTVAVGGGIALRVYHDTLVANVENSVDGAANAVATAARRGPLPNPIPMPVAPDVPRVQVLDHVGKVVSGDPTSASAPPMFILATASHGQKVTVSNPPNLPERHAAVIAEHVTGAHGPLTIIAAGSLDPADAKAAEALGMSAIVGGILLLIVAVVAWETAGRTLRRVERLRAQVSAITANGDLARRVPDAGRDELADLGSTLNTMLATMSDASERQRRFVADAAHELRTPIAGITAALEVAQHHPEAVDQGTLTAKLVDGHRRLGRLVNDLLELARLDGGVPSHRQAIDLSGLVADSIRRPSPRAVDLHAGRLDHAVVMGDPLQLSRIIANLVDNALRYADREVEVRVVTEDRYATVSVADDGPGVPIADRDRIWGRFVRLDDDRARSSGGTGLGLALVKDLVDAHGGAVRVMASPAGGACFSVCLPLAPSLPSTGPPKVGESVLTGPSLRRVPLRRHT